MVVFGVLKSDGIGAELFRSESIESCHDFIESINKEDFFEISIDDNNGLIVEKVKDYSK